MSDRWKRQVVRDRDPGYPSWTASGRGAPPDPSRRRFLRQVVATTGGVSLLSAIGLPNLAHGQSTDVDFSVLDAHPTLEELAPAPEAAPAPTAAPTAPAAGPAPAPSPVCGDEARVVEDRALWIEPGYLVLLRWDRPVSDTTAVAALEGATDEVQGYLSSHVAEVNDLHDLQRLHGHEQALIDLLSPTVEPARIEKLHLDHDCNTVCSALTPSGRPDPYPPLGGVPMVPEWE